MYKIRLWLQSLTQHQRILALALFITMGYFLWSSLWGAYYTNQKQALDVQNKDLQAKIKVILSAQEKAKALRSDPDVLATKKRLDELRDQLQKISRRLVSSKQMVEQLSGILQKDPEIKLTRIQNMGSIPFSLEAPGQEPDKKASSENAVGKSQAPFYEHFFEITFESSYFSAEEYIQQLENLPGQLYFDSFDYQVQKYPIASVSLKVHTISLDEGLMDA